MRPSWELKDSTHLKGQKQLLRKACANSANRAVVGKTASWVDGRGRKLRGRSHFGAPAWSSRLSPGAKSNSSAEQIQSSAQRHGAASVFPVCG